MSQESSNSHWMQWTGLIAGPLLCCLTMILLPHQFIAADGSSVPFSWAGRATLAVMIWMGVWWLTEAVEISVTALLPIGLFPLLGVATVKEACFPYADPLIFLYFGGFIIALSMERWGLGKRIALLTLRGVGTSAPAMIAGFMLVTAGLSAFVSNTATTAMMLPIALSVIGLLEHQSSTDGSTAATRRFATCLLLAIAYSASVGGVMTIIGTPTNTFLVGFVRDQIASEYRQDFSFAGWLPIGFSICATFLPLIYWVLTRVLFPIHGIELRGGRAMVDAALQSIGKINTGERVTLVVFLITVALWLFRPLVAGIEFQWQGVQHQPLAQLSDTVIAMTGAMLLFLIPVELSTKTFTMDWHHASRVPWGILLLFGGGLSLAAAVQANGVAEFIGSQTGLLASVAPWVLVLMVTTVIVFLTELTSNAATTASLVPVLAALAPGVGVHPYLLIFPATVAASCAFMLPVATPPNAIIFGSGRVTVSQMVRAGFWLNVIAIFLVTGLTWIVFKPWLGI
jgi:solute carrier family 13 (sodium-dependent dicarboxylate transporter), member 2/3/5